MSTRTWWRRGAEQDFADEVASHLEHEIDRLVAEGMQPEDARAAAHRSFGNVTRARERYRDRRPTAALEQLAADLRYAARGLRQNVSFAATVVLTLATGLALVTVVFAVFNAYFLRPFAVRDPYGLYLVRWQAQDAGGATFRWRDFEQFAARSDLFDGIVAETTGHAESNGRQISVSYVSGNYFESLGPQVALGRPLLPADARTPGGEPVALLSDQAWGRLFGRDPLVVGKPIEANGVLLTIVGVMGPDFVGLDDVPRDVWAPLTMHGVVHSGNLFGADQPRQLHITVRLRHDVTPEQVAASLAIEPFETSVEGRLDAVRANLFAQATPVRVTTAGVALLSPVIAAFGLVLVAACANASNVMLARGNTRHRELGIRLSIGASRGRVVRQLVTEGFLVAALAGALGLLLASGLLRLGTYAFVSLLPPTIATRARFVPLDFDARVFLFAFGVASLSTIFFALLPALQATRLTLTDALRGQATGVIRGSTLRNLLITGQVAVSLLLLIVASTLVRNGNAIRATDIGFPTNRVISVRPSGNDSTLVARTYNWLTADERFRQTVVASRSPLFGDTVRVPLRQPSGVVAASLTFVTPDYFSTLHIPIVHGRTFLAQETIGQGTVALISAKGAHTLWPGEEPIGKTLRVYVEPASKRRQVADAVVKSLRRVVSEEEGAEGNQTVTVVGVVGDIVSGFVYQGKDPVHIYLPLAPHGEWGRALLVKLPTGVRLDALREELQRIRPDPLAYDVLPLDEMVALQQFPLRAASWVATLLSGVALVLSISGLYGVLTYAFGQRTQEIGIRMALGATGHSITRLVLLQSARLAIYGAAFGLLSGFTVMKLLSTVVRLENVSVIDVGAFAVSIVVIMAAVGVAAYGPARRAVRIDPTVMLRADS